MKRPTISLLCVVAILCNCWLASAETTSEMDRSRRWALIASVQKVTDLSKIREPSLSPSPDDIKATGEPGLTFNLRHPKDVEKELGAEIFAVTLSIANLTKQRIQLPYPSLSDVVVKSKSEQQSAKAFRQPGIVWQSVWSTTIGGKGTITVASEHTIELLYLFTAMNKEDSVEVTGIGVADLTSK